MSARIIWITMLSAVFAVVSCGSNGTEPPPSRPPAALAEGDTAPSFSLRSSEGRTVGLDDVIASRPVLFYFSMGPG